MLGNEWCVGYWKAGKLSKQGLTFFKEIFEDWKRNYKTPLKDEIDAFKML